ncbi:MAG TPA: hypothetical protein VHI13_17895 [Candidatus Kapabacteria bacterium]|nr:hypothetical protein [Candidatus Kapabacteria bacterium]
MKYISPRILTAIVLALAAYAVALAAIDCTKIHVYDCSVNQGGDVMAGGVGSVPGGATVTAYKLGAPAVTRETTAKADGSFFAGVAVLDVTVGDQVVVKVGKDSCIVTVEPCP